MRKVKEMNKCGYAKMQKTHARTHMLQGKDLTEFHLHHFTFICVYVCTYVSTHVPWCTCEGKSKPLRMNSVLLPRG